MNVNINDHLIRVIVLMLTTELSTVLTAALPTQLSTATKCSFLQKEMRPALYNNVTANGNSKGAPCVFPFFYNGSYYDDCVSFDRPNLWCSTTANYTRDGQWGECLDYDVCQCHRNLSDPWRNIGFNLSSFPYGQMYDLKLKEGWYRFTGIGGDRMSPYTCNASVTACVRNLDCGAGLILYYLVPIRGAYRTRHSSCSASSCGLNAPCNASDGSCMCSCDNGIQATEAYSACRDYCGFLAIPYDMLDMNTYRLHAKEKTKDKEKTNNDINNTLVNPVNPVLVQAMVS
ncbi:hypothetical protein AOLI_G00235260 [Acnodon oligacanthus]